MRTIRLACVVTFASFPASPRRRSAADVTAARIIGADKEPHNWLSHGRTYSEQRFSPLNKINTDNVEELGLAWSHDIKAAPRAGSRRRRWWSTASCTPAARGAMCWRSRPQTGKVLWDFDPQGAGRACGARLLRRRQPRRRGVGRQGVRRHL